MKPRYLYPKDYYADPSANVFNGKLFVYPSHDWEAGAAFDDDGGHFQMKDYHVISMEDVEEGEVTDHGMILHVDQVKWAEKQMWDNDVVEKDGKYYLIFSAKDYNGVFHLGVAVADRPEGPFVPEEQPIRSSCSIDPCAFKDDDGQIYVYFGGLWGGQLQWYRPIKHIHTAAPKQAVNRISPTASVDLGPAPAAGDHLGQGQGPLGIHPSAAHAGGDAVLSGPQHIGRAGVSRLHVGKAGLPGIVVGVDARHAAQAD